MNAVMNAMVIDRICDLSHDNNPLSSVQLPLPVPGSQEVLIKVSACGVCHTELDEIEGRTAPASFPMVPGHQVVGRVVGKGPGADRFSQGDRIGVAWIYSACGACEFCRGGLENLCPGFKATGRDSNGGYAEFMVANQHFAYQIPERFSDQQAAPLLCAGAIGYRSLALTGLEDGQRLGLTGFGASAHLVLKMVRHRFPGTRVYVFARSTDEQAFAKELGAVWAGHTDQPPTEALDCIIDTTPAWNPVIQALKSLRPAGRLVINAIRKEAADQQKLMTLDYTHHLWQEKEIKSVANVARRDVQAFLELADQMALAPQVQTYRLQEANQALLELKQRRIRGAKVLLL
ncbi:MAG: zinc-dependent alcohol dehydrogenase family protein [Desulfobacteraceae bacterium]|jgi:propanol-preferring alcohol dehydrogenase